jgi:hypothetical protein
VEAGVFGVQGQSGLYSKIRSQKIKYSQVLVAHACILVTQNAEIRRIEVQSQSGQIVHKILSLKNPSQKRVGGVAQGVGSEFKPQYCKNK